MTALAVLFDMDGVLVDSYSLHERAYEQVFKEAGIAFPRVARAAVREGKTRSEVIALGAPGASAATRRQLFLAKSKALATVLQDAGDVTMPGAMQTVRALADAGISIGIVTNSGAPGLWLDAAGIKDMVSVVVTSDDVSSPKPSPEGFLLAAQRLGVSPARCMVFEDSYDGWLAALRARMQVVLVSKTRPAWVDSEYDVIELLDPSSVLSRCARLAAGDDA
jgi:HAD superfamily hydrolase (TIGR01509 family)